MSGWDLMLGPLGSGAGALFLPNLQRADPSREGFCWAKLEVCFSNPFALLS